MQLVPSVPRFRNRLLNGGALPTPDDFRRAAGREPRPRNITLPSFSGSTAAGSRATLSLPIRESDEFLRYHEIYLTFGGGYAALANIEAIRLIANGETVQEMSLTQWDYINRFDGRAAVAASNGTLVIDFQRARLRHRGAMLLSAFNLGVATMGQGVNGVNDLRIEVQIAAGAPAGITLAATARVSTANPVQGRAIIRRRRHQITSTVGENFLDPQIFLRATDYAFSRLFFVATAAQLTALRIDVDGKTVWNMPTAQANTIQTEQGNRVAVAAITAWDPSADGSHAGVIRVGPRIDVRPTFASALAVDIIVETLGRVG